MAQHGTAGWTIGPVGSAMDGVNANSNDGGFVGQVDHNSASYLEAPTSHESHYEHVGYAPNGSSYGQQSHGQYATQHQYSDLGFGVEGQPAFPHDMRSLGPTQVAAHSHGNDYQQPNVPYANSQNLNFRQFHPQDLVGHYPDFAQAQQHVGVNDFQRNSWAEAQSQHSPSGPYAQGQQLYGNNPSLLRMATASPAQSSTPKPEQSQASYQVNPASSYQPQAYGEAYQTPQSTEVRQSYRNQVPVSAGLAPGKSNAALNQPPSHAAAASHPLPWSSQGQAQRLGNGSVASAPTSIMPPSVSRTPTSEPLGAGLKLSAPSTNATSGDVVFVPRAGKLGEGWKSLEGCPNLFVGATPVRRQVVTNTPGVKPHVAGDNRNGTALLPSVPNPLPCEVLREKVRPMVEELKRVSENIGKTKEQINSASVGSEEHKRAVDELKKLETRKASLESDKKKITGKAGTSLKVGRYRATGKSEAAEYETESPTESSEEEDPQELIVQQIMASKTRPTDPEKGTQYDVVKIIRQEFGAGQAAVSQGEEDPWSKVIGRRVADFGKYVVDICAEAKALREQKSTASKSQSPQLQTAIDNKYALVRVALETALEFGDEETLRNMGQHMKLMSSLTIVLSRQFANKTYNTDLPRSVLHFFSEATLMDMDIFRKVKLSTVLEKHGDNLDDEGKQLVAQILKNAEERTAKNAADKPVASVQPKQKSLDNAKERDAKLASKMAAAGMKDTRVADKLQAPQLGNKAMPETARKETKAYSGLLSARKVANNAEKAAVRASPSKRPRDEEADSRATKKVAVENNTGVLGSARTVSTLISNSTTPASSTPSNGQPRPARPLGSTVLNKSRVAKPTAKKPEPQSSMSSTISGLLAEIAKPAEKPKPQERPVKAPETPAEKERRLRKEARRGRTVTWKPDDELVQIRIFEHDSTEDEGRASNMIRDARDNRLEGQMLKQMQRSMQEGDDDDDDGNPTETDIRPWVAPQLLDYSILDDGQREKNYVTCGGIRAIHSEQKKVMEEYENRELISIYTTLSEIPESPRSPPRKVSELSVQPTQAVLLANDQKKQEVHLRWSESRQYGATAASQYALRRLGHSSSHGINSTSTYLSAGPSTVTAQSTTGAPLMSQEERDARVLALLQSDRARNYVDPTPYDPAKSRAVSPPASRDEKVQIAFSIIQNAVDQCRNMPTRPIAPSQGLQSTATPAQSHYSALQPGHFSAYQTQAQMQPQVHQQQHGYPQLAPQVPDQYAAILQQVQALQNPQAAQSAAIPQPKPAQPDNGLANLLAALGGSAQPAQAATQDSNYAAWQAWAQSQAQSYGAQSQAQPQGQSYPSYSQQYENTSRGDEATYGSHKQDYDSQGQYHRDGGDRGNRKEFNRGTKDHKGINRALIGTKPCSFWAKGQCAKGDNCTFRHDPNDLK